jgi:hypothetical protein
MNISDTLKQDLLKTFGSEKKLKSSIDNYELYNFQDLNTNQLLKLFKQEQQSIFTETNSKKHLTKIFDMIKANFYNQKTNHFANLFLNPIKDKDEYNKRKEIFSIISDINLDNPRIKDILKNITQLTTKIAFNKTIYTLEPQIQTILYDNYKITAMQISKNDLEEMLGNEITDFILVTEEEIFLDIDIYSLKDFQKIIIGNIIKKNSSQILNLLELLDISKDYSNNILTAISSLTNIKLDLQIDSGKLINTLSADSSEELKMLTNKALRLEEEVENINKELKQVISKKQLSLAGDELLELLNSGDMQTLQNKFKEDTKLIINEREKLIVNEFKKSKINLDFLFTNSAYPLILDEDVKPNLIKQIDQRSTQLELETYKQLGSFDYKKIKALFNYAFFFDFFYGILKFTKKYELEYPQINKSLDLIDAKNMYIDNAMPISYSLGTEKLKEKISILTGANSGGKTTLLEMFLQAQILTHMGLGVSASKDSSIKLFDEVIYLKKFTGTQGSGAFEQTIRNLIDILDTDSSKLILIDEFEAITEPGAAAKILIAFLKELSEQDKFCIAVSHLGQEIQEFITEQKVVGIRIDGISASGLDEKGNLITNHQPQFNQLGKSTPELILKRVLQDENFWKGKSGKSKSILEKILE